MSRQTQHLPAYLRGYLETECLRESPVLARLRRDTARLPQAPMQIAPEQGRLLAMLVGLLGARRILEVGTFTGYSALAMAEAMGPEGRLLACDLSRAWTTMARHYWRLAGVEDRIELRLGPALETLDALLDSGAAGRYDLAFIDADKTGYDGYYERSLQLLRPGGLVVLDNTLWGGSVARPGADDDPDARALRALNRKLRDDPRVDPSPLPIADGLTLARKRAATEETAP